MVFWSATSRYGGSPPSWPPLPLRLSGSHLQGPVLRGSEKWSICLSDFLEGFRATGIDGSSIASIGSQTWSNKCPLLHVHSDLQCSQLVVTHDLQNSVRSQKGSQPSSFHGHDRHQGALGSPGYRGYLPSVAPRAVGTRHPRTSWQQLRVNLARSHPNSTRCSMLLDGILIAVFQGKTYWNARGLFGRHRDPNHLLLEGSSNIPS